MFAATYNLLAYGYNAVGEFEKSIGAINKYVSLAPDEPNPYDTRGDLYAFNGKIREAIDSYRTTFEIDPEFLPSARKLGHMHLFLREYARAEEYYKLLASSQHQEPRSRGRFCLALIPAYRGRFDEALQLLDEGIAADRMDQYAGTYKARKHRLKAELHLVRGEYDEAVAEAREWCAVSGEVNPMLGLISRAYLVLALVENGELQEAERICGELSEGLLETDYTEIEWRWIGAAFMHVARGDAAAAVANFGRAREVDPVCPFWPTYVHVISAQAYLENGMLADAVAELEREFGQFDESRAEYPTYSVRAHYLAGLAYEQSGWTDRAVEQYEEFLTIWKDADPGSPEVDDARERLARLRRQT